VKCPYEKDATGSVNNHDNILPYENQQCVTKHLLELPRLNDEDVGVIIACYTI